MALGWASWIRTSASRSQSPLPYRLAIAQNLIYFEWWRGTDSNRRTQRERIYSPPRLATSLPLHVVVVPAAGLEPATY
jgi:hypothetical protein